MIMAGMHSQQFNDIASQYSTYVGQDPFRIFLHYPAIIEALRPGPSAEVLDVGCGDGLLAEVLTDQLGSHVTGYDLAPAQIEAASARQLGHPSGNRFVVATPETFVADRLFDAATSVMVLPYASDVHELQSFFTQVHRDLRPGGQFISVAFNPCFTAFDQVIGCRRFDRVGADGVRVCFLDASGKTAFTSLLCHYSREDYAGAAKSAGFQSVRFSELVPSVEGVARLGEKFWCVCKREQPYVLIAVAG